MQSDSILKINFAGCSEAGVKEQNQDAFAARCPTDSSALYKGAVACIADGVSCSENSQQASQMSVTHFIEDYYSTSDLWGVKQSSAKVLAALNSWLHHHGQHYARHNGFVTTFSSIVFKSNSAHIFHVGDSRVYLCRQNPVDKSILVMQVSKDHQQYTGADQSYLSRALGMDSRLDVDYYQEDTQVGDVWLLTTDGVHDTLSEQQIEELISSYFADAHENDSEEDSNQKLSNLADTLVQTSLENNSPDNTSCLLARVEQLPEKNLEEVQAAQEAQVIPPVMSIGNKIDQFEVVDVLYAGIRSYVYKVKSNEDQQYYCLKTPAPNQSSDEEFLQAFTREQWLGSRIDHPNIMKVYHQGPSQFLYHIYEFIEGMSLRQWMYDNPAPDLNTIRKIISKIIPPLRAFQRMGMVHRDLKPENIMLIGKGDEMTVKIIDFGSVQVQGLKEITHLDNETMPQGAVDYMAPEYVINDRAEPMSDLYSLAAIVYEILAGKLPYETDAIFRQKQQGQGDLYLSQWRYQSLPKKDSSGNAIPSWIDATLRKALEPDINKRYEALSEFETDLYQPNTELLDKLEKAPLLERNPLLFWKSLSLVLFLLVLLQGYFLSL